MAERPIWKGDASTISLSLSLSLSSSPRRAPRTVCSREFTQRHALDVVLLASRLILALNLLVPVRVPLITEDLTRIETVVEISKEEDVTRESNKSGT